MSLGTIPEFVSNPNPQIYLDGHYVCLDLETTNLDKGSALNKDNRFLLACWFDSRSGKYKNTRENTLDNLFVDIERADFLVCHNAKFELHWLHRLGWTGDKLIYDTYIAEYVYAGNRKLPLDLDSVARSYDCGAKEHTVGGQLRDGVCPSTIPYNDLLTYCQRDVEITCGVLLAQSILLNNLKLLPVVYTRCLLTPVLVELERNGLGLDRAAVEQEYKKYNGELQELRRKLDDFTGGINPSSPPQMSEYLYGTLGFKELKDARGLPIRNDPSKLYPEGSKCTDSDTILLLKCTNQKQREFVDLYKDFGSLKVNTKTLEKLWQCCLDNPDLEVPILWAAYNQCVTQTHRLSSTGAKYKCQFHNFNRDFKPLFRARHAGWFVGEADGKQLEFRVAVHLGRDPVGSADIRDVGFDAHVQTLSVMLNGRYDREFYMDLFKRYKAGDKEVKRQRADNTLCKGHTFKPLFAGQSGTPREKAYYAYFRERYRVLQQAQEGWAIRVSQDKKLVTETGLIFYWPHVKVDSSGYIKGKTAVYNYPVQSLATADIIPIGLVCVWYRMRSLSLRSFLVNTVHDAVIGEIHPDETDIYRRICEYALTTDTFEYLDNCYRIRFTVPLGAEVKIGTNWGRGKETSYDLDPRELFKDRTV